MLTILSVTFCIACVGTICLDTIIVENSLNNSAILITKIRHLINK